YGHGIMQLTFNAWYNEPGGSSDWDNTGIGSFLNIYPCANLGSTLYTNCYTDAGTHSATDPKPYKDYGYSNVSTTYKLYTNTQQSLYANIKDGMRLLQTKFKNQLQITTSTTPTGTATTYSGTERELVIVTEGYGPDCGYVDDVAGKLDTINKYFAGSSSS